MSERRCINCDPKDWRATPAKERDGWLRVTCAKCGKWIGYRPVEGTKGTKR